MEDGAQEGAEEGSTEKPAGGAVFRKDANEVLIKDGPTALEALVQRVRALIHA